MENLNYIRNYFENSIALKNAILANPVLLEKIESVAMLCVDALKNRKRVFFAGNGGSAADAQHMAAEFVSRFNYNRPGLAGIALTTDTSILTAIGNDYGYEYLFSRQLEALAQPGDVFIGLTTSGNSPNILRALEVAKAYDVHSVVFCGQEGRATSIAEFSIDVPSKITPHIQEAHITVGHIVCAIVEFIMHPKAED